MPANLDLQNIFFFAIGSIPGYLYLHIVSRSVLGRTLSLSRKTIVFVGGLIFSLCISLAFDKVVVPAIYEFFHRCGRELYLQYIEYVYTRSLFEIYFSNFSDGKGSFQNGIFDFFTIIVSLNVVALVFGLITSVAVRISKYFTNLHPLTPISYLMIFLENCDMVILRKFLKPNWHKFQISWNVRYYIEYFFAIIFALVVLVIFLTVISVWIVAALLLGVVWSVLRIFTSQWFDILNQRTLFAGKPIFELLGKNGTLFRGTFSRAILSSEQDTIQSITLSNVISYKKATGELFFDRKTRMAHRFSNPSSSLTLLFSEIENFNIWYLSFDTAHWNFEINNQSSVDNHVWFFEQIIKNYRSFFGLNDFEVKAKDEYAFIFLNEIADLIKRYYLSYPWTKAMYFSRNREIRYQLIKITRLYISEVRRKQASGVPVNPVVISEMNKLSSKLKSLKAIKVFQF